MGSTIRSKKKVKWIIDHKSDKHIIEARVSFLSGKKKLFHNGMKIVDIERLALY